MSSRRQEDRGSAAETVFLVPHTHWDREWYHPVPVFRQRLVDLVDELLDSAEGDPPNFLLDGQVIVLSDYLAVRPEREAELSRALRAGRLEGGPWFVLADNLIPSGEALIRNLLLGRERMSRLRARSPSVLYCPDAFGHPAAAPVLAAGFGLNVAIIWRGYGGREWPVGDSARWRGADGSEVLLHHLPREGYTHAASLPAAEASARELWGRMGPELRSRSLLPSLLVLNGADHHALQLRWVDAVRQLSKAIAPAELRVSGIGEFASEKRRQAAASALPVVRGELRSSPDHVWSLQDTTGTRTALKRLNAGVERALARDCDPWVAVATWHDGRERRHQSTALWTEVLEGHPHDTLCGCSIDAVAQAAEGRLVQLLPAVVALRTSAIMGLIGHDAAEVRDAKRATTSTPNLTPTPTPSLIIRNPGPRSRGGVVELAVDTPLARVPVGAGTSGVDAAGPVTVSLRPPGRTQLLNSAVVHTLDESPRHFPVCHMVRRDHLLCWMDDLPGHGIEVVPLEPRSKGGRRPGFTPVRASIEGGPGLDNGLLKVWCSRNGLHIRTADGKQFDNVLGFESTGERGDLYTHSGIPGTTRVAELRRARLARRGPLRGGILARWSIPIAERNLATAADAPVHHPESSLELNVFVELDAGRRSVRLIASGVNRTDDWRLRLVVRSGCSGAAHRADAAFGALWRRSGTGESLPGDCEVVSASAPLHRYTSVFDAQRGVGLTIISDGLAQYEAGAGGTVAVTILRATGELSRADLPERRGHAGWPSETPAAQSYGPFDCRLALYPHGLATDATLAAIEREADDELVPPRGSTLHVASARNVPRGLVLEGDGLRFETAKLPERGPGIIARCSNITGHATKGEWSLPGIREAMLCRLDETPLGVLPLTDGRVLFSVPRRAVSTLLLLR
ncbi:MAG: hypothetical protein ACT4OZ_03500 [Gemmatimonadota bacterium]